MKKTYLGLITFLLFLPAVSFAQTAVLDRTALLTELAQLESELMVLLQTQAPQPATTAAVSQSLGTVQVRVQSDSAWKSANGISDNISLVITNNTNSTIYIPATLNFVPADNETTNAPGITYTLDQYPGEPAYEGSGSGTIDCSSQTDIPIQGAMGYIQACAISAGQSVQVGIAPVIRPASPNQGSYAVSFTSMSYATTVNNPSFTIVPIPTNKSTYVSI